MVIAEIAKMELVNKDQVATKKAFGPDHSQIYQMLKLPLNYWSKNLKIHRKLEITHVANKEPQPPTTPQSKN
jgi:hypothetical protein